jgi:TonB family protein
MYPKQARIARVAGTVKVSFVITHKGKVENAVVVSGNPLLRDAALASVRT